MALIIFLIILSLLVLVHEAGHFGVAKFFGIRVDEFGLGYPPRAAKLFSWKDTLFTLNWLPFGGFVKIFGENYSEPEELPLTKSSDISTKHGQTLLKEVPPAQKDSFQYKNRGIQAAVLVAGVVGNFLFAWLLFSIGFMTGLPAPAELGLPLSDPQTVITTVLPESPADEAGLKAGDSIVTLERGTALIASPITPEQASAFITESLGPVNLTVRRGGETLVKTITPENGIWSETPAIGVSMEIIGTVELSFLHSISQGLVTSAELTVATAKGLAGFLGRAFIGRADLSSVAGPVGLVGLVGDVTELGWGHLLSFTALISINLALINLLPIPALDGGRLLFVLIEAVTRRRISPKIFNAVNAAGFVLLILLMVLITVNDVGNLF